MLVKVVHNGTLPLAAVDLQRDAATIRLVNRERLRQAGRPLPSLASWRRLESFYDPWRTVKHIHAFNGRNSVLLQLSRRTFMHIGHAIYTFRVSASEEIQAYRSPMGNSCVPYPYAIGRERTYLLLERVSVPRGSAPRGSTAIGEVYGKYWDDMRVGQPLMGLKVLIDELGE